MKERNLKQIIEAEKIILYGIGNQFKECYKLLKDKQLLLFDGNPEKWGERYNENTIISPDKIMEYVTPNTAVVITSINNQYEIAKHLVDNLKVPAEQLFMYTSTWYEKKVYKPAFVEENWDKILACSEKLADEESKKYYLNSVIARQKRNPLLLMPNLNSVKIGEYGDKFQLETGEEIIDCGAYTGDTAELYIKRLNGDCIVYAIEPYQENYDKLQVRIVENRWENKIKPYNCAVSNVVKDAILNYNKNDFGMAINLSNDKGQEKQPVTVETLDNLFGDKKISYIKMDIEGEEKAALEGARGIISSQHPKLMISGYHKIEDFWEIPEVIWSINSNYQIYVGHAPGVSTEVEFYCICKQ